MALLPDRHPQKDFFILDISDVVPKDDTASMEHPMFSLATKPDMRHLLYKSGENSLEIVPSSLGLPSIKDKDILIFCISQLMHRKNRGEEIGKRVRFSARELMMATNRNTDGREYKRVEKAFQRLQGTQFKTSIRTGNKKEVRIFSLIDEGGYVMREEGEWRPDLRRSSDIPTTPEPRDHWGKHRSSRVGRRKGPRGRTGKGLGLPRPPRELDGLCLRGDEQGKST